MRNYLIFAGVNSADYGIYITGSGVYNAPERDVERVTIPGRNGLLMIDQGRYENISVEYPAFAHGKSRKEFREKIEAFRNAIASKTGYQRLEDSYNPDEYRMGLYAEGINVDVGAYGGSGRFTLKFDCKPQRFLKDGEIPISVPDGECIINPTPYESRPLLMVEGSGNLQVGDYNIDIVDTEIGTIKVADSASSSSDYVRTDISKTSLAQSDAVTIGKVAVSLSFAVKNTANWKVTGSSVQSHTGDGHASTSFNTNAFYATITMPELIVTADGTGSLEGRWELRGALKNADGTQTSFSTPTIDVTVSYANTGRITVHVTCTGQQGLVSVSKMITLSDTMAYSTLSSLGNPTYIDCDIGECYKIEGGDYISLNNRVALGADLLELKSGANEVSFDNTITELSIVPRWFKL